MPSWWGKSSSKEVKRKANKESFIDALQRKLKIVSEDKCNDKSRGSRRHCTDTISEKGSRSLVPSRSPSPSTCVSRCQSFVERPHAQPLPLPGLHHSAISRTNSVISVTSKPDGVRGFKPSPNIPLPKPGCIPNKGEPTDAEENIATASVSSCSSIDSHDPSDLRLLSPLASDCKNANRTTVDSPLRDHGHVSHQKNSKASSKPFPHLCNSQSLSTSPKAGALHLQIAQPGGLFSAPDSSMSSPSRSPMRAFGPEQVLNSGFWTRKPYPDVGSGQSASPGSGHNSRHNSIGGDLLGQMFWSQSRFSPECSPLPSPRMTSPGPSSRIQSGAVTPQHPRAGGLILESPNRQPDDCVRGFRPSLNIPLPKPGCIPNKGEPTDAEENIATASVYSGSSIDSDDLSDSRLLSPLASDCENANRTTVDSPLRDHGHVSLQKNSKASSQRVPYLCKSQFLSTSPKAGALHLQIAQPGGLFNVPDSSMSSPSRSPMRAFGPEQVLNSGFWTGKPYPDVGSGQCASPGSGQNSEHNSIGRDLLGQMFWSQSRCSPECSPLPSPRMTSPGPSSRIQSGAVTPQHPRAGGPIIESPTRRPDDGTQQTHRLPLPPIPITNSCPVSPTYSAATTPSARSPGRSDPTSPGSCWKKGPLLGRGTFGHVYLGFNSESGEMCAMKEVTLFSDDAKSKECAQQLGQEIALLSRLKHQNIVRYYGFDMVDDSLYIYLEYVSGGSIYKLLQQYGQLGEVAIRNYTQQILSGLAYLHAKNTVHRDIKGANILVDPNGRVKLADFGMAKHINGQSCPLSLKGSPYWMAPEVIKNSSGCSLAVDIWSLGCTVLEMATTKPPWSQYEGVAAMFKIGNSKELPAIPDHLSEHAKNFVRLCLHRNPLHRPTAAQLLDHPFIKSAPIERPILHDDPSDGAATVTNAVRSLAIGSGRHNFLDSEEAGIYPSRSLKTITESSDAHTPRNISSPVSPTGSPLSDSRSPYASGRMSPSPISSPHTTSGSSTPLTGGSGAIPFHLAQQSTFSHEGLGMIQRSYHEPKHDAFWGIPQTTHAFQDVITSDNDALANQIRRPAQGDPREFYDGKSNMTDCVSQQLLRDHVRLNSSLYLKPSGPKCSGPVPGRIINGL